MIEQLIEQLFVVAQAGGPGIAVVFCGLFLMERRERHEKEKLFRENYKLVTGRLSKLADGVTLLAERMK